MTEFVDTFALIAWLNHKDADHEAVSAYLAKYTGRLVTTEWVLVEFADALSAPQARSTAIAFLGQVRRDAQFDVVDYDRDVAKRGFELYAARPDKSWSLTDCISFVVMAERKLTKALTSDHHFEQAGFRAVFKR